MKWGLRKVVVVIFFFQVVFTHGGNCQISYPEVGKPCPDFILNNIKYFRLKKASLNDFRGKWLILDFWNKYCGACLESFPGSNVLQQQFEKQVQIMLVGLEDPENMIRPMFAKFKEKMNLNIPCAFDSLAFKRFDIGACPHIIIIDSMGIVRGITNEIDAQILNGFLEGKTPVLNKTYWRWHDERPDESSNYSPVDMLLKGQKTDTAVLFLSMFTKWMPGMPLMFGYDMGKGGKIKIGDSEIINSFQLMGVDLPSLYRYAFLGKFSIDASDSLYGKYWFEPIFEVEDSSSYIGNYKTGVGVYSFDMIVPRENANVGYCMRRMQQDLHSYFGYYATIEERKMPLWTLSINAVNRKKLISTARDYFYKGFPYGSFKARKYPARDLIKLVYQAFHGQVVMDKTFLQGDIDITMDCIFTDPLDVKNALEKNGFEMTKGEKTMKVIVVKKDNTFF